MERLHSQVFGARDAKIAGELAVRRTLDVLTLLVALVLFASLYRPLSAVLTGDAFFAVNFALLIAGLLSYNALVRQAVRRRLSERNEAVVTLPGYTKAWLLGIGLPIALATTGAIFVPHNISPLLGVDWNRVAAGFTEWVVGLLWISGKRRNLVRGDGTDGTAGFGNGERAGIPPGEVLPTSAGTDPVGMLGALFWILFMICCFVWGIYVFRKTILPGILEGEEERYQGFWGALKAFLLFPWRALVRWWRRKRQEAAENRAAGTGRRAGAARRLGADRLWLYPDDPVKFIRFVYARLLKQAASAGFGRHPAATAQEFAQHIALLRPAGEEPVAELTDTYCRARYGRWAPDASIRARVLNLLRRASRYLRRRGI